MGVECGVSLSFLVPDQPRSGNNHMAARDIGSRVACTQVVGSACCVSFCLFSANWPYEILGRPTLATLESTAFLALGFGAVNGQDFPTRRDPLGRFTLFLISQLVSGSRVSLTQGRAGPAGVETAGREHGSCNHAVGE